MLAGAKYCIALLDLIKEMQVAKDESGEQQLLAAKAVCVLALAAADGDIQCVSGLCEE